MLQSKVLSPLYRKLIESSLSREIVRKRRRRLCGLLLIAVVMGAAGCAHFRPAPKPNYVYVTVKQAYLRDRVAAVSNRVALVANGDRLEVLERQHRWVKVRTKKNETGWIEERSVASGATAAEFDTLKADHAKDPIVAIGSVRDEIYMHAKPGRDTDRFYLLPEGKKVQLLARAVAEKPHVAMMAAPAEASEKAKTGGDKGRNKASGHRERASRWEAKADLNAPEVPDQDVLRPPREDWWLARDAEGHVGWLLSRRIEIDVPDAIAGYAEGQKIVGAYVLATVEDRGAKVPKDGNMPDGVGEKVPEYVVVLNAYKNGLSYDFDQVRVFTWSLKKHRYETAYRERRLAGELPLIVGRESLGGAEEVPTFRFKVATGDAVRINAATGAREPGALVERVYRLDGSIVRRVPSPEEVSERAASERAATQERVRSRSRIHQSGRIARHIHRRHRR